MEKLIFTAFMFIMVSVNAVADSKSTASAYSAFDNSLEFTTQKSISENKKGQLQLIYFWASWCPDCKAKFKKDLSGYQNAHVDFITLSIEDNKEKIAKFIAKENLKYPVYFDVNRQLQKDLKVFSVPTVILTRLVEGKPQIIHQVSGKDWEEIDSVIQQELKKM